MNIQIMVNGIYTTHRLAYAEDGAGGGGVLPEGTRNAPALSFAERDIMDTVDADLGEEDVMIKDYNASRPVWVVRSCLRNA
jgi:hypothetical protein